MRTRIHKSTVIVSFISCVGHDTLKGQQISWLLTTESRNDGTGCGHKAMNDYGDLLQFRLDVSAVIGSYSKS